jgi:hypothetical protein
MGGCSSPARRCCAASPTGRSSSTSTSALCARECSEIVVDGRGNIYVNSIDFDFLGGGEPTGGVIALITPDGNVRQVAGNHERSGVDGPGNPLRDEGGLLFPFDLDGEVARDLDGVALELDVRCDGASADP